MLTREKVNMLTKEYLLREGRRVNFQSKQNNLAGKLNKMGNYVQLFIEPFPSRAFSGLVSECSVVYEH